MKKWPQTHQNDRFLIFREFSNVQKRTIFVHFWTRFLRYRIIDLVGFLSEYSIIAIEFEKKKILFYARLTEIYSITC